ncbi:MAG: MerC domain-containing protein [Lewinella sp.]|uniref:MerC domain-containing protein n=1 Tax=Lewinella sp. TaxID=2004506 RepID=UPI003D6C1E9E
MRLIRSYLDIMGFSASFLCAIHCLLMPLILSFGLVGGLSWLESPLVEWTFILSTLILASWSLLGSLPHHHNKRPLIIAAIGFIIILGVHFLEHVVGHFVSAIGGVLIAYAHYVNWRLLHNHNQAPTSSSTYELIHE